MERLSGVLIQSANCIPSGRQLPRTPPMTSVKRHLSFGNADEESVMLNRNPEVDGDDGELVCSSLGNLENPFSMLKGMKGYRPTPDDLNFLKKKTEDELIRKLQGELAETQALLKKERNALELALSSKEILMASLNKLPSNDQLSNWAKMVLGKLSPLDFTDLDMQSLLGMVTIEQIQRFSDHKKKAIAQMKATAAEKCKREAEDLGQLEVKVASEELKIQELMTQLTDLKLELSQQEKNSVKEPNKDPEKPPATKDKRRRQDTQKKDVKMAENAEEIGRKSKRGKKEIGVKPVREVTTEMSRQKSGATTEPQNLEKASRGRRQKVEPQETQPPGPGLRRSKRIANRS